MDTVIEFEPETITAASPPRARHAAPAATTSRGCVTLLRPIIIDLLEDELSTYTRMRG